MLTGCPTQETGNLSETPELSLEPMVFITSTQKGDDVWTVYLACGLVV